MVEGLSHTLEEWLDDGRLNLACVFDGSDETTGRRTGAVREEPFVFVGNADALRPRTVRSRWPRRCASRWWCRRCRAGCARCWKTRRASSASRSMCASRWNPVRSRRSDRAELGYSILPASVVSSRVQRGELAIRRIFQPDWSCTLRLVWPLGGDLSSATQAVIKLVSEVDEEARKSRRRLSGPRAPDHFGMAGEPRLLDRRAGALRCSCIAGAARRGASVACRADGQVRLARYRT